MLWRPRDEAARMHRSPAMCTEPGLSEVDGDENQRQHKEPGRPYKSVEEPPEGDEKDCRGSEPYRPQPLLHECIGAEIEEGTAAYEDDGDRDEKPIVNGRHCMAATVCNGCSGAA